MNVITPVQFKYLDIETDKDNNSVCVNTTHILSAKYC